MICKVIIAVMVAAGAVLAGDICDYNLVWDIPSKDYNGSMPLGNGDIGANVWVEPNGDLCFYISKTDAWSDNGRLLKVGKVRVTCEPALVQKDVKFRQELDLKTGSIVINDAVTVFVDANNPVINVSYNGDKDLKMTAAIELWRTEPRAYPLAQCSDLFENRSKPSKLDRPVTVEPDTIITGLKNSIGWFHHNKKSAGFEFTNRLQGLGDYFREDPLLHRTFGGVITGSGAKRIDDVTLESARAKSVHISVHVLTAHPVNPQEWVKKAQQLAAKTDGLSFSDRQSAHNSWWNDFWKRSWIYVSRNEGERRMRMIPESKHNVRVGIDQNGGNRFGGEIARVSLYEKVQSPGEISDLAKPAKMSIKSSGHSLLHSITASSDGKGIIGAEFSEISQDKFSADFSIEAWVKPNGKTGRIADMITPGGADGFLLDTYPGNSLRFIAGNRILSQPECLKAGVWQHVAAVVNSGDGTIRLYLNGSKVAELSAEVDDEAFLVSRSYNLQRFIDACAGRGNYPIKFNGSIFTVPHDGDPDFRRWGPGYWWQNTRLPYLSMCAAGDYDLMKPFFKMYAEDIFKLNKFRTAKYLGHGGAYYPECMYFWGSVFTATYGWTPYEDRSDKLQESGWHKWEWVAGPELVFMMLDYYDYTQDEEFLKKRIIPVAVEVLRFFDEHYETDETGELVMHPSMACETWWNCTNPMPELAGLHAVTARLLDLPSGLLDKKNLEFCAALTKKLPPLPLRDVKGGKAFAPATKFASKRNCENPELYAVFPFRLCAFEKGNAEQGKLALKHRWDRGAFGWRQDDLFMAYLGLTDDARKFLVSRCRSCHKASRFPAFWGPNYDWVPDQDHAGVMMRTVQAMIMQADPYSRKVYLTPAWPADWDCEFKLHAPYKTVIEGRVMNGKVVDLKVTPASRKKDVVVVPVD